MLESALDISLYLAAINSTQDTEKLTLARKGGPNTNQLRHTSDIH